MPDIKVKILNAKRILSKGLLKKKIRRKIIIHMRKDNFYFNDKDFKDVVCLVICKIKNR